MFSSLSSSFSNLSLPNLPTNLSSSLTSALSNVSTIVVDSVQNASTRFATALQDEQEKINEYKSSMDKINKYQSIPIYLWQLHVKLPLDMDITMTNKECKEIEDATRIPADATIESLEIELKQRISDLTLNKQTFLIDVQKINSTPRTQEESHEENNNTKDQNDQNSFEFIFNWQLFEPIAMKAVETSSQLAQMRFLYVPKRVDESIFWYRYFYHIEKLRHDMNAISLYRLARFQWDKIVGMKFDNDQSKSKESISSLILRDEKDSRTKEEQNDELRHQQQQPTNDSNADTNTTVDQTLRNSSSSPSPSAKRKKKIILKEGNNHSDEGEWNEFISDDFVDTKELALQTQHDEKSKPSIPHSTNVSNSKPSGSMDKSKEHTDDEEIAELEDLLANVDVGDMNEHNLVDLDEESDALP